MNWLAHIFLSEQNINFQLGNFLADPMKGRLWDSASDDMIKGVNTHKLIDSYTDSHKIVSQSKARLRKKGLLKPLIIDLTYDYLLTKNWNIFCNIPIREYIDSFYKQAKAVELPNPANSFVQNLVDKDRLNKYHKLHHLEQAFERIDARLSKKLLEKETSISYIDSVYKNINDIEDDFLIFFPQMCKYIKNNLDKDNISHWHKNIRL